jgi:hypothetical protein
VGEAVPNIPDISKSTLRESFMEIRALTAEMEKAQAQWQLANEHKQTAQQRLVTACTAAKSAAKLDPTRYDCLGSGDIQRLK